ncbi:hypothetical protein [Streptomyces sp. NPDC055287]
MTEVHGFTLDVGSRAPVSLMASLVSDIEVVAQSALEMATHVARSEADNQVMATLREGGVRGLIQEARRRELPGSVEDEGRDLVELEQYLQYTWRARGMPVPREHLPVALLAAWPGAPLPWSRLIDLLRDDEMSRRLPREPYRFRSISYRNPFGAEILAEAGAASLALAALLRIIQDWGPRRRRLSAIADNEADLAKVQIELRRRLLEGREVPLSPDAVERLLIGDLPKAVGRLTARELQVRGPDEEASATTGADEAEEHEETDR